VALLRVSSSAIGEEADLAGAVGRGDGAIPHGAALVRFAEAATRGSDDLSEAREALREAIGLEAFIEAAATVGIFNGLVRTADSIGIPIDGGMVDSTADFRGELGLNDFSGSRNTDLSRRSDEPRTGSLPSLFGD